MLVKILTLFILIYSPYQELIQINNKQEVKTMTHPIAKQISYSVKIHDTKIDDEYNWLRDQDWPKKITDQNILGYLNEENDYFHNFMNPLK